MVDDEAMDIAPTLGLIDLEGGELKAESGKPEAGLTRA
jgi:hypothetical protein